MKITKRQLKRIIKEEYTRLINEYGAFHGQGAPEQVYQRMQNIPIIPARQGHGWMEFIEMAERGDYDSAGGWISGLAGDYGIQMTRDEEDGFIELGSADATAQDLTRAFDEYLAQKGK